MSVSVNEKLTVQLKDFSTYCYSVIWKAYITLSKTDYFLTVVIMPLFFFLFIHMHFAFVLSG